MASQASPTKTFLDEQIPTSLKVLQKIDRNSSNTVYEVNITLTLNQKQHKNRKLQFL